MDVASRIPLPLADPLPVSLARLRAAAGGSPGTTRSLSTGQVLLREDEFPTSFWVIQSGAVALSCSMPGGRRATVAVLFRGSILGEQGLSRRVAGDADPLALPEARAVVPTTVHGMPLPALRLAMIRDRRVGHWVVTAVAHRASQVQRTLARTLGMRVPERLLGVLRDLAVAEGSNIGMEPGTGVSIAVTQDLLASMVGATRESVNRALGDLQARGLVNRIGSRYVVACSPAEGLDGSAAVPASGSPCPPAAVDGAS